MSRALAPSQPSFGRVALAVLARHDLIFIAGLWFAVAFGTVLWAWGLNPVVFQVTDEAVVRQAARLVRQQGSFILKLPFADPEDLAHMRSWLSQGDTALPIYAPVMLYGFGLLLRLNKLGLLLIELLPSTGIAAFAAGAARLLPVGRRWLALLAPLLGFASFYWVLHPWLNLSPVLSFLSWSFFFWTSWRDDGRARWLVATTLCVGAAAAVRPDYAAFLLISMVFWLLANDIRHWRPIAGLAVLSGACALVPNLILNKITTGHALRAVYQLALDREYGIGGLNGLETSHGFDGLRVLRVLLIPLGVPTLQMGVTQFMKYFITMSIAPVLLLAQLALIPLWRKKPLVTQVLYFCTLVWIVFFIATHLHGGLFGDEEKQGLVYHSVPRYLAPAFLFAALPPLLFLGQCRRTSSLILGSVLACLVAGKSAYEIYVSQPASLVSIHQWVSGRTAMLDVLAPEIPNNAIVYSAVYDKVLWSRWSIGVITEHVDQVASSMNRAVEAGLPVYVLEPKPSLLRPLRLLLRPQFILTKINARRGLFRLDRVPPLTTTP